MSTVSGDGLALPSEIGRCPFQYATRCEAQRFRSRTATKGGIEILRDAAKEAGAGS